MIADPNELQRLRFQEGQDLLSRDFQDGALYEARLREWHNRALHAVHGVRFGLRARPVPKTGSPTAAAVSAGLAYEADGSALFLTTPALVPVPSPWPGGPHLLVLREGAALAWVPETQWRPCAGVPLARLIEDDGEPVWDEDYRPPAARPLAQPRIGHGATIQGGTAWEILRLNARPIPLAGFEVEVDTRAAGFTRTPCYFAGLQGRFAWPLFSSVENATPTSFRFRLLTLFPAFHDRYLELLRAVLRQTLGLSWLGLQDWPKPDEPESTTPSEVIL
jgi:hypothetical protein